MKLQILAPVRVRFAPDGLEALEARRRLGLAESFDGSAWANDSTHEVGEAIIRRLAAAGVGGPIGERWVVRLPEPDRVVPESVLVADGNGVRVRDPEAYCAFLLEDAALRRAEEARAEAEARAEEAEARADRATEALEAARRVIADALAALKRGRVGAARRILRDALP
jgi:hypothetical protein